MKTRLGQLAVVVALTTSLLFMVQRLLDLFGLTPVALPLVPRSPGVALGSGLHVVLHLTALASVFITVERELGAVRLRKGVTFGASVAGLWMLGVLQTVPTYTMPWGQELLRAVADGSVALFFGLLLGSLFGSDDRAYHMPNKGVGFLLIGGSLLAMRAATTDLASAPGSTLGVALVVGSAYVWLGSNPNRRSPLAQAAWFGGLVFGVHWLLLQLYLPFVYVVPFAPVLQQVGFDVLAVIVGTWCFEQWCQPRSG